MDGWGRWLAFSFHLATDDQPEVMEHVRFAILLGKATAVPFIRKHAYQNAQGGFVKILRVDIMRVPELGVGEPRAGNTR